MQTKQLTQSLMTIDSNGEASFYVVTDQIVFKETHGVPRSSPVARPAGDHILLCDAAESKPVHVGDD